jgi:hypothetical protein
MKNGNQERISKERETKEREVVGKAVKPLEMWGVEE